MLYIVSTPIGNLGDMGLRALRVLEDVNLILCEDTRHTRKLLHRFEIVTPTQSYHQHSNLRKKEQILDLLKKGKEIALVSDAGTPGISDPGARLIEYLVQELPGLVISSVPGPSAVSAALSVSGFNSDSFLFLGFPPKKKHRSRELKKVEESEYTTVLFESPHRVLKTLEDLKNIVGDRRIVVCRELTKMFEKIYRGNVQDVLDELYEEKIRGEFVIVIDRA